MKPHQNLDAWKLSFQFTEKVYELTKSFPKEEIYGITSQIRRAAVSVPVNIAEGAARHTDKQFIQFLHISLGSASELDTLILLSKSLGYLSETQCQELIQDLDRIGKTIYGLIKYIEKRQGNS